MGGVCGHGEGVCDERDYERGAVQCAGYVGCAAGGPVGEGKVAAERAVWAGVQLGGEYFGECTCLLSASCFL